jgi:hypothetical protein
MDSTATAANAQDINMVWSFQKTSEHVLCVKRKPKTEKSERRYSLFASEYFREFPRNPFGSRRCICLDGREIVSTGSGGTLGWNLRRSIKSTTDPRRRNKLAKYGCTYIGRILGHIWIARVGMEPAALFDIRSVESSATMLHGRRNWAWSRFSSQ